MHRNQTKAGILTQQELVSFPYKSWYPFLTTAGILPQQEPVSFPYNSRYPNSKRAGILFLTKSRYPNSIRAGIFLQELVSFAYNSRYPTSTRAGILSLKQPVSYLNKSRYPLGGEVVWLKAGPDPGDELTQLA